MEEQGVPYGERLLPRVLNELAESEPERLYASVPRLSVNLSQGFRDIRLETWLAVLMCLLTNWRSFTAGAHLLRQFVTLDHLIYEER